MEIAKQIIFRACMLPRAAELAQSWTVLMEMISDASPSLFERLKNTTPADFEKLEPRMQLSVHRYFNRAKFRPIPYGKFASVGLLFSDDTQGKLILDQQTKLISLPDWTATQELSRPATSLLEEEHYWRVQSTLYYENGSHYFFQSTEGKTELFCIAGFTELDQLLYFCTEQRTTSEIRSFAKDDWDFISEMMVQLVELQVIVHDEMPNLTGRDYFSRLGREHAINEKQKYHVSLRHGRGNLVTKELENELLAYVEFAKQHFTSGEPTDLSEFKKLFSNRYENQWQPLATVLDPSKGIGYANLSQAEDEELEKLLKVKSTSLAVLELDNLNIFLMAGILSKKVIDLKNFSHKVNQHAILPNTISALLQPSTDGCWLLDHLGGVTATALLGRFAFDEQVNSVASNLVNLEKEANPDVIFFDISYQTGDRTDNINRRPQLYDMELALGGWSVHPRQLQLSDIFVNVINGELLLYSYRHCSRLVPRMASAYNVLRSSHPLLRLLADLQYQGLQHQFLPELSQRFPNLDSYPELRYGKLIIQPRMWKVDENAKASSKALKCWLIDSEVDRFIRVGHADQYLCLDTASDVDCQLLLDLIQRNSAIKYVSARLSGEDDSLVENGEQKYNHQLQINLSHKNTIYQPVSNFEKPIANKPCCVGGDWFFVSLYASSTMQHVVLSELIEPLLVKYNVLIDKWFYVLYADPNRHIRLRLKWKPGVAAAEQLQVNTEIGDWLGKCGISDMAVKPYLPEQQRYGEKTIALVEQFFHLDSHNALFDMKLSDNEKIQSCKEWMKNFIVFALKDTKECISFTNKIADLFSEEMGWGHLQFKQINQTWREISSTKIDIQPNIEMFETWKHIQAIAPYERHEQLLADLIHMHVNRRFTNHARLREAQLYQYLLLDFRKAAALCPKEYISPR